VTVERDLGFVGTNVLVYAFDKSSSPKKRVAEAGAEWQTVARRKSSSSRISGRAV
jgi:hypothetical protein